MQEIIYHVDNNFTVSWDPEVLTKDLFEVINIDRMPFSDPSGSAHWQRYNSNVIFARNFFKNFSYECQEVVDNLTIIRDNLKKTYTGENNLVVDFLNHTLHPRNVNLIKTVPGKDIMVHKDITRNICINIGLKNSNKWVTYVSKDNALENFNSSEKDIFTLEDGDTYLIKINNPHKALCTNPNDLVSTRFLITYTII